KSSTRTARRRALTRATSKVNPFRRPLDTLSTSDPAAGLTPMIRPRILGCWVRPFTQLSFVPRHRPRQRFFHPPKFWGTNGYLIVDFDVGWGVSDVRASLNASKAPACGPHT